MKPTPASIRARAEAESIARRLLAGEVTAAELAAEYGCGRNMILRVYRTLTTAGQRRDARTRRAAATPASLRARSEAAAIVARLLRGGDSTIDLAREYGCDVETINRIYRAATTRRQREQSRRRKLSIFHAGMAPACAGYNRGDSSFGPWLKPFHFRKGELRGMSARRYRPVGTIGVQREHRSGKPFRVIKVSDTAPHGVGVGRAWLQYARWVWEKRFGPVPAGKRVMHRDGKTLNDDPSNLVCLTGGEALRLITSLDPRAAAKRLRNATRKRKEIAAIQIAANDVRRAAVQQLFTRQRSVGLSNAELSAATGIDCKRLWRMRKGILLPRESERAAIVEAVESRIAGGHTRAAAEPRSAKERAAARISDFLSGLEGVAA